MRAFEQHARTIVMASLESGFRSVDDRVPVDAVEAGTDGVDRAADDVDVAAHVGELLLVQTAAQRRHDVDPGHRHGQRDERPR